MARNYPYTTDGVTTVTGSSHTHDSVTGASSNSVAANTDSQGVGGTGGLIAYHPYQVVNYIIKT